MRGADVVVTLYLDSFFLLNLGMNLWLLFLTGRFLKLRTGPGRMLGAAGAGAAGGCAVLAAAVWFPCQWAGQAPVLGPLLWAGMRLAGCGLWLGWLMVRLAFGKAGWRELGKRLAVFWMAAALTGGLLAAGYGRLPGPGEGGRGWKDLPVFVAAVGGSSLAVAGCWNLVQARIHEKQTICEAVLWDKGKNIQIRALWDTGNQLFEPYTHQPVHVITREACRRLRDPLTGIIFVPFQAVGTRSGILPAIRVESMEVVREGNFRKQYDHPWLAVSEEALSPRGQYDMLLHGEEW